MQLLFHSRHFLWKSSKVTFLLVVASLHSYCSEGGSFTSFLRWIATLCTLRNLQCQKCNARLYIDAFKARGPWSQQRKDKDTYIYCILSAVSCDAVTNARTRQSLPPIPTSQHVEPKLSLFLAFSFWLTFGSTLNTNCISIESDKLLVDNC